MLGTGWFKILDNEAQTAVGLAAAVTWLRMFETMFETGARTALESWPTTLGTASFTMLETGAATAVGSWVTWLRIFEAIFATGV